MIISAADPRRAGRIRHPHVPSSLDKHSVVIAGHKTSISIEDGFWRELRRFARDDACRLTDLVDDIDVGRRQRVNSASTRANLSSAIRLYVLDRLKGENAAARMVVA